MTQLDLQPTLVGTAITMRPLVPADWDALFAVAADPLIWAVHPAHDRWQQPVFRQFFAETLASGAIIGHSRYDHGRAEPGEIEIGWTFLARSAWGGTSNAEMKRLMLGHALQSVERVVFLIGDTNYRSRRAMEKIGGVLTPRTQHTMLAGSPVTHLIYAIDRAGFATGPLAA